MSFLKKIQTIILLQNEVQPEIGISDLIDGLDENSKNNSKNKSENQSTSFNLVSKSKSELQIASFNLEENEEVIQIASSEENEEGEENDLFTENELDTISNYIKKIQDLNFEPLSKNFSNYYKSIAIDGTCAVGKSTIGAHLQLMGINFLKSNKFILTNNHNSHPANALGYVFTTLELIEKNPNTVWDRMASNNLFWNRVWIVLTENLILGQPELKYDEIDKIMKTIDKKTLQFSMKTFDFILINSNVEQCHKNLSNRNEGSDAIRSGWKNYIKLQNYCYSWLAKEFNLVLIDVADYDNLTLLQRAIATLCKDILDKIPISKNLLFDVDLPKQNHYFKTENALNDMKNDPFTFESLQKLPKLM